MKIDGQIQNSTDGCIFFKYTFVLTKNCHCTVKLFVDGAVLKIQCAGDEPLVASTNMDGVTVWEIFHINMSNLRESKKNKPDTQFVNYRTNCQERKVLACKVAR